MEYGKKVFEELRSHGIRVELDERSEKIGYKIRDWETKKVPYMLVVGEKERSADTVAVRQHTKGDLGALALKSFTEKITREIAQKLITT